MQISLYIVFCWASLASSVPAATKINGRFEGFDDPLLFQPRSTEITGWTVVGPRFAGVVEALFYSFDAVEGANCANLYAADLASREPLFPDFLTVPGTVYTISFHLGRGGPGGGSVGIRAEVSPGDGIPVASLDTFAPSTGWTSVSSQEFQAKTASTLFCSGTFPLLQSQ